MQNASAALLNWFQDGHAHIAKPKENLRKTKVFSLRPLSSGPPGWGHFCSDLMVYACKTHLRLSGIGSKMGMQMLEHLRKTQGKLRFSASDPSLLDRLAGAALGSCLQIAWEMHGQASQPRKAKPLLGRNSLSVPPRSERATLYTQTPDQPPKGGRYSYWS